MSNQTDKLKIREVELSDSDKVIQEALNNCLPRVANGLTASQLHQITVMAENGQVKAANHLIRVFLRQNSGAHIVHENPFKRKQLDCISFARFYKDHSRWGTELSDEQIYELWQEKSREK